MAGLLLATRSPSLIAATARNAFRDIMAGILASVVLISNIVSFGALMFPGELSAGVPIVVWAMLIGGCVCGCWIALATSIPPLTASIDSPTGTVLVLLSAATGAHVMAAGGSPNAAIQTIMVIFTVTTFLSGALLFVLGVCRWGSYLRFVPSSVVGGFLGATGCFLLVGGYRMLTGHSLSIGTLASPWTTMEAERLAAGASILAILVGLRLWVKWPLAMPVAVLTLWIGFAASLHLLGLSNPQYGWYFQPFGELKTWQPFSALHTSYLTWKAFGTLLPEIFAVLVVGIISLVTKVSSIEAFRQTAGDLDCELRSHGLANVIAAPLGGLTSSLQVGASRLLSEAGAATRVSGVVCAAILGMVAITHFDLPSSVPIPLVGGLVFYLAYGFIVDALKKPYSQGAWFDLTLVIGITVVCVHYGYLLGVLAGLVCACMLFATSYARLGVIRRHATRADVVSNVDRSPEAAQFLRDTGNTIHVYWLSGYIFFGSSESLFERIRSDLKSKHSPPVKYVIIDFGLVSGTDAAAMTSLLKVRRACDENKALLLCCSLSDKNQLALRRGGFISSKNQSSVFHDLNSALAWCEDQNLGIARLDVDASLGGFEVWLERQLGTRVQFADFLSYLVRKDLDGSNTIYRQGDPADTVDLVAAGRLDIEVTRNDGMRLRVRRVTTHTVVGEMGFFRRDVRSASVISDGPAILFTLTRANFDRMRRERPAVAAAFGDFIVRVLADRIDTANRELAALTS